jgi:putative ABC transport system permease protein
MLGLALFPSRAAAIALGAFGLLAISLGATGLYGLVSYAVSKREREIGIRMAVGAAAPAVLRLVLTRIALLVCTGAIAGAGLSLLMANVLASVVYTASPYDPVAFAGVGLILLIVGVVSCWGPAIRALRVSPTAALKAE